MQKIQHDRIDQQESGGSHASPKKHAVKGKTHIGICQKQRERKAKEGSSQSDGSFRKADHASFEAGTHVFLQSGIFHAEKRLVYKHRLTYDTGRKEDRAQEKAKDRFQERKIADQRRDHTGHGNAHGNAGAILILRQRQFQQPLPLLFSLGRDFRWFCRFGPRGGRLPLAAKQLIAGHAEDLCKDRDHRQIRRAVAPLPAADCLTILLSASSSG